MSIKIHYFNHPSQVVVSKLNVEPNYKQECIDKIYNLGNTQKHPTNVKAINSSYTIWKEIDSLKLLINKISRVCGEHLTNIFYKDVKLDQKFSIVVENAWSAIYKKGDYTLPHNHNPANYSFVYYLKSNGSTPLVFEDSDQKIYPMENDLILFPGHLKHSVPKHEDEEDRICLAGNLIIKTD